ncbi:MAG: IPTL-CTERM sorting domain-containing protein [Pseudomonadota bacterium]
MAIRYIDLPKLIVLFISTGFFYPTKGEFPMKKFFVFLAILTWAGLSFAQDNASETIDTVIAKPPIPSGAPAYTGPVFKKGDSPALYDNGPMATCTGCGDGGADESILQSLSLGMGTYGFGCQIVNNNSVADDFEVTGNWLIDTITVFAYQTGSGNTSTINDVRLRIWDGQPGAVGSSVIWGDLATNILSASIFSNIYRTLETSPGTTVRPIMANTVTVGKALTPGTYWLEWQVGGSSGSGPWAPPLTTLGQSTTGNALHNLNDGGFNPLLDAGNQQGLPFIIQGRDLDIPIPTVNEWGMILLGLSLAVTAFVVMRKRTGTRA